MIKISWGFSDHGAELRLSAGQLSTVLKQRLCIATACLPVSLLVSLAIGESFLALSCTRVLLAFSHVLVLSEGSLVSLSVSLRANLERFV